jgi:hypothetical protein
MKNKTILLIIILLAVPLSFAQTQIITSNTVTQERHVHD